MVLTEIVIVGAGIAGLAAAKTLEDNGFSNYVLVEAQEKVGGRIHSIPWSKGWIEFGAQFLHGDKSDMAELCYRNYLLSESQHRDGEGIFLRDNGCHVSQDLLDEVDDFIRTTLEECENYENENIQEFDTIGRVLRTKFKKYLRQKNDPRTVRNIKKEIFDWNIRFLMIDNSCFSLDDLSAKNWGKFKFVGGPEYLSFKSNYSTLVKLIADNLNKKNLRLNTAVEFIEWHPYFDKNENKIKAPITLTLSDKSQILADSVIITSSLGYLKENYKKIFYPPLPSHLSLSINSLGFGLINKIFLDFGTPWWESGTKGFQFLWSKKRKNHFSDSRLAIWTRDLTGFDVLPDHRSVLLGWVGGSGAYIVENLSEQQIAIDCINLLQYYLKLNDIPMVKRCKRTQWYANKYIRGSYSHITISSDHYHVTPATLAQPIWGTITRGNTTKKVPILMFAGEGTHENFYSTTHGAYDTGVKQAQTFLQHRFTKV